MFHLNINIMKTVLVLFALLTPFLCCAQTGLSGSVRTEKTNQPIEDCHVYINEHLGTVTNENGEFQLAIPEKFIGSELHVSHIAYKTFVIPANELENNGTIVLEQAIIMLDEVVVRPETWIMFQESVDNIISNAKDKTDDYIYYAILNELEEMKPPLEVFFVIPEKSELNK